VGGSDTGTAIDVGGFNITGASQAGINLQARLEAPIALPALAWLAAIEYNRLTSKPGTGVALRPVGARAALTDQTFAITSSLVIGKQAGGALTPYVVMGGGLHLTRLGTNADPEAERVTEAHWGLGPGIHAGAGLRFGVGRHHVHVEWRYAQALNHTRGSSYMPLAVGVMF
jgi:hypothetical protein